MVLLTSLLAVSICLMGIVLEPAWAHIARSRSQKLAAGSVSLLMGGFIVVVMATMLSGPGLGIAHAADPSDEPPAPPVSDSSDAATPGSDSSSDSSGATQLADEVRVTTTGESESHSTKVTASKSPRELALPETELDLDELNVEVPPRPSWVTESADLSGEVHRYAVSSDLHARVQESRNSLDEELVKSTNEYIAEYLGSNRAPLLIQYDIGYIREHLVQEEFTDTVKVSFGPMHQSHGLLVFHDGFRHELQQRWEKISTIARLLKTGAGGIGVLALLGVVFGYLRLDSATRGYYSGRLRFAAALAMMALLVAGVMLARTSLDWVRWLL